MSHSFYDLKIALLSAIDRRKVSEVIALLDQGADANGDGDSLDAFMPWPLLRALTVRSHESVEIAKMLVARGAATDRVCLDRRKWWLTALHMAADQGLIEVVELIIAKGENVNQVIDFKEYKATPLDAAKRSKKEGAEQIGKLLRAAGGRAAKELCSERRASVVLRSVEAAGCDDSDVRQVLHADWTELCNCYAWLSDQGHLNDELVFEANFQTAPIRRASALVSKRVSHISPPVKDPFFSWCAETSIDKTVYGLRTRAMPGDLLRVPVRLFFAANRQELESRPRDPSPSPTPLVGSPDALRWGVPDGKAAALSTTTRLGAIGKNHRKVHFLPNGRAAYYMYYDPLGVAVVGLTGAGERRYEWTDQHFVTNSDGTVIAFSARPLLSAGSALRDLIQKGDEQIPVPQHAWGLKFMPQCDSIVYITGESQKQPDTLGIDCDLFKMTRPGQTMTYAISRDGALIAASTESEIMIVDVGRRAILTRMQGAKEPAFVPQGGNAFAFVELGAADQVFVVVDTRRWGPFRDARGLVFSDSGKHLAYWAQTNEEWRIWVDGAQTSHPAATCMVLAQPGAPPIYMTYLLAVGNDGAVSEVPANRCVLATTMDGKRRLQKDMRGGLSVDDLPILTEGSVVEDSARFSDDGGTLYFGSIRRPDARTGDTVEIWWNVVELLPFM